MCVCVCVCDVQEHEILNAWLTDLGFEEYYDLFVQSGYDMHTITRMTPEVTISLPFFHGFLPRFTAFYWVLPRFTEFYRVLPSFTEFYRVLPRFT